MHKRFLERRRAVIFNKLKEEEVEVEKPVIVKKSIPDVHLIVILMSVGLVYLGGLAWLVSLI